MRFVATLSLLAAASCGGGGESSVDATLSDGALTCGGPPTEWAVHGGQSPAFLRITPLDAAHCPGQPVDVTPPTALVVSPYVVTSSDGRFAAIGIGETNQPPGASFVLDLANPAGPRAVRMMPSNSGYSISPAGNAIALIEVVADKRALHVAPLTTPLIPSSSLVHPAGPELIGVVWSPDGALMAYVAIDDLTPPARPDAYLVDMRNGPPYAPVRLYSTAEYGCNQLSFAPDGRWLACRFGNQDAGGVALFDVRQPGSPAVTVLRPPVQGQFFVSTLLFTPDGRYLVYAAHSTVATDAYYVDVTNATPGTPQRLHPALTLGHQVRNVWVSPDSRTVVLVGELEASVYMDVYAISIAGSTPGPVTRLSDHPINDDIQSVDEQIAFTPTGDRVYFSFSTVSQKRYLEVASLDPAGLGTKVAMPTGYQAGKIVALGGVNGRTLLTTTLMGQRTELLAIDSSGVDAPIEIRPPGTFQDYAVAPQLTFDGTGVLFASTDPSNEAITNLYVTDLRTDLGPQQVNAPFTTDTAAVTMATSTPAF